MADEHHDHDQEHEHTPDPALDPEKYDAIAEELAHLRDVEARQRSVAEILARIKLPKRMPRDDKSNNYWHRERNAFTGTNEVLRKYDETRVRIRKQIAELRGDFANAGQDAGRAARIEIVHGTPDPGDLDAEPGGSDGDVE